jgi:hypothetical protein
MPPKRGKKPALSEDTANACDTAFLDVLANPERLGTPIPGTTDTDDDVASVRSVGSARSARSAGSARSARSARSVRSARSERSEKSARSATAARSEQTAAKEVRQAMDTVVERTEAERKRSALIKLHRLKDAGVALTREYTVDDDLGAIEYEVQLQQGIMHERLLERKTKDGVKFARRVLLAFTSFTEFVNKRYDPFGVDLDGWSESVMENISDYDSSFERLLKKYAGKAEMAPEVELVMALGSSAFMFHLSKKLASSMMMPPAARAEESRFSEAEESDAD